MAKMKTISTKNFTYLRPYKTRELVMKFIGIIGAGIVGTFLVWSFLSLLIIGLE